MALDNIYLKETPLTSTKNKFLIDHLSSNSFERCEQIESLRKKFKGELTIPLKCLTENKILLESKSCVLKVDGVKKKKKKKLRSRSRAKEDERIYSYMPACPSAISDAVLFDAKACLREISAVERSVRLSAEDEDQHDMGFDASYALDRLCVKSDSSRGTLFGSSAQLQQQMQQQQILSGVPQVQFQSQPSSVGGIFGGINANNSNQMFCLESARAELFRAAPKRGRKAFAMAPGMVPAAVNIPETFIPEMPSYKLETLEFHEDTEFFSLNISASYRSQDCISNLKEKKLKLLNTVSMALMCSSNLTNEKDDYRNSLIQSVISVKLFDPEFILKVALYARQELHLRTVTNFLLSYAAYDESIHCYLEKYFNECIVLPSDWIQVAQYYQALSDGSSLPSVLRRAMRKAFPKFDQYQLAKYNRIKPKKKNTEEKKVSEPPSVTDEFSSEGSSLIIGEMLFNEGEVMETTNSEVERTDDKEEENGPVNHSCIFTLKKLIRVLHINSPVENVLCLLGKKYPTSYEDFKSSGLPGTWDPSKAGTRMKLPTPETWETKLPSNGNVASVWESLIDNKKLPYMATLRNLRNLILSGISPIHHKKVVNYLENKTAVIKSRQLPMQFFEAYKVISDIENMSEGTNSADLSKSPVWFRKRVRKLQERLQNSSIPVIKQYKNAISNALEISSLNNLHPVPGKTVIICLMDPVDDHNKNKSKAYESALLMGLMCLKACEDCKMSIVGFSNPPDVISLNENDKFLDVMMEICDKYKKVIDSPRLSEKETSDSLEKTLGYYLKPQTLLTLKLDHVILMEQSDENYDTKINFFLHKYRQIVNSDLLYTNVKFSAKRTSLTSSIAGKDVYLTGFSSSLVKFIAERSNGGQIAYVDNIDMTYDLRKISVTKKNKPVDCLPSCTTEKAEDMPTIYKTPKWHTVRVFISSTFKDMMSERDLMIRYVFPELKKRAASVFVKIAEIDLRWGITEADSSTQRVAELCLLEAQRADFFVGMIGDRYGTIYDFDPPSAPELQWVKEFPSGLSITELEMHAAALRTPKSSREKAFFYFRNNSFLSHVPKKWVSHFNSEDVDSKNKVEALKKKILNKDFKVFDGYPCNFAGIYENKPILAGLEVLGNRVLEDLWEAVQKVHKGDPYYDDIEEEELFQQAVMDSQNFYVGEKTSPIENIVKTIESNKGIFVITGCAGSGKTAFTVQLLKHLTSFAVVKYFVGLSPRSRDLSYMLQYISNSIRNLFSSSLPFPKYCTLQGVPHDIVNQFPDILMEAVKCSGGRDIIIVIDGLDHLEKDGQTLDWLPLSLPDGVSFIFTVSDTSEAFKFLSRRVHGGSNIIFEQLPPLQQSDREKFVRNYLEFYSKTFDESDFNNHMLKVVTKTDSSNPYYLRVVCDYLRIYATFDNLQPLLQKLPSSTILLFQEVILQMENGFGSDFVQTLLTLLCITKEGLEENDLHYILSVFMHINTIKTSLTFSELKQKMRSLQPDLLMCQVKFCSIMCVISTFCHGTVSGQKSYSLANTEFEKAVKKFYLNKNYVSQSLYLHSVLAGYYHFMCDINDDGRFNGQSGSAFRSLLYHLFHGKLFKELYELLCCHKFLVAVFRTNVGPELLEYYSSLLSYILNPSQKVSHEIDHEQIFTFYDFVSRSFHIFLQYPHLVMQQALNEPLNTSVSLKSDDCTHHLFENLSRSDRLDCRIATFNGFIKNITASASGKTKPIVVLGSEDGYLKILDMKSRKVYYTIKGHSSAITCITFVGKNRLCASSVDNTLSLWDSEDFSRVAVLKGHRHSVTSCCEDPFASILYSSGWDNTVRLWSLEDGRPISVMDEFKCPVNCINHHPLKQEIACGLWNGNIEIWNTTSLKKVFGFSSFSGSVKSLAYTPDGVNIISSFFDGEISIWSSQEGLKISSLKGHILPVKAISFSYDNSVFVSGSDDCTLKVWSAAHGSHLSTISESKFCPINIMNFLSENLLAVAFQNSEIRIFDIIAGNSVCIFTIAPDFLSAFSKHTDLSDGDENVFENLIVFGTKNGKLMIGDLLTSEVSERYDMGVKITAIVHNCDTIFCGTAEGDIGFFSYPDEMLTKSIPAAHKGFITTLSLTMKDEELLVLSTASDNQLKLWNVEKETGNIFLQQELSNLHKDAITYSLFYPCKNTAKKAKSKKKKKQSISLEESGEDGWIQSLSKKGRKNQKNNEAMEILFATNEAIENEVLKNKDSNPFNNLLTGSHENTIILWNEESVRILKGLHSSVVNITCSGDYILGCSNDGALVMWSRNGEILTSIPGIELSSATLTFFVAEDEYSKFNVVLAFVDQDGSIVIKKPLQKTYSRSFEGHSKPITSCCSIDDSQVISCSLDGSVNLWKVPSCIESISLIHSSMVTGIIVSPSFEQAVSSDAHGNLVLWKINLEEPSSPLTYAGKKNLSGCFIRALSWQNDDNLLCAGSEVSGNGEENYFLYVISLALVKVMRTFTFSSEIICLDYCPSTDSIVVGLNSGIMVIIDNGEQHQVNVTDDWILKVQFLSKGNSDLLCASLVNGDIAVYKMADIMKNSLVLKPYRLCKPPTGFDDSKFTTSSLCCGEGDLICCGDSEGVLRIYSHSTLKFIQKIHDAAISGICIVGSYLFTCSFDKSVKGWDLKSYKQVCMYCSSTPVTCMISEDPDSDKSDCLLLIGMTSGDVHLLKLHSK